MEQRNGIYGRLIKRILDFCIALLGIIILSPVFLVVAFLVRVNLGKPIIFKQERPGRNEKIFCLYKFRTMTDQRDKNGELLPDVKRLTPFGRLLRSTSLDELPQLWNILKGDMSIVGPRPLAVVYLPYYTKEEHKRHLVRPGLTGLAQVNGRNAISWEKRFAYDLEYVQQISLKKDIEILFRTCYKVLKREAIGQGEEAPECLHIVRQSTMEDNKI